MTHVTGRILQFTAAGNPKALGRRIEDFAQQRRVVAANVVPWEGDERTVSLSVTSVRSEGWAIEHTNLGTIRLTDLGGDRTGVELLAHEHDNPDKEKLAGVLGGFAKQLQGAFELKEA